MFSIKRFRNSIRNSERIGLVILAICLPTGLFFMAGRYAVLAAKGALGPVVNSPEETLAVMVEPISNLHLQGPVSGEVSMVYTYTAEIEPALGSGLITYTWDATEYPTIVNVDAASDTVAFTWWSTGTKTISVTASNEVSSLTAIQTATIVSPGMLYLPVLQSGCEPFYFEDFSNPDPRWLVEDTADFLLEYNNAEYRALVKRPDHLVAINPVLTIDEPNKLEVSLRNETGVFGSYGLLFGLVPDYSETYEFEIYPDSYYAVWYYHKNAGWNVLTEGRSDFIAPGNAVNHMSIIFNESTANFYVNGHSLTELAYTPVPGKNNVGMIVFSYDSGNVDIRFDNFRMETVECYDRVSHNLETPVVPKIFTPGFMFSSR